MSRDDQQHRVDAHRAPRRWRMGIAECLALAFAAVLILAVCANVITRRTEVEKTRVVRVTHDVQSAVASGNNAIEALETYHAALLTALDSGRHTEAELGRIEQRLTESLEREVDLLYGADADGRELLHTQTGRYIDAASALVAVQMSRQERVGQYMGVLGALDQRVTSALDGAWKIFGRVLARQSLLALSRDLETLRLRTGRLVLSGAYDAATVQPVQQAEAAVGATLQRYEKSLRRSQGEEWLGGVRAELQRLTNERRTLVSLNEERARRRAAVDHARQALRSLLGQRIEAAKRALPPAQLNAQLDTAPTTPDSSILVVTIFVLGIVLLICAATVYRVAVPVQRLLTAMRALANGDADVWVARGGLREVDSLSDAFNNLALQLKSARASVHAYQMQLEARVDERTRQLQHLAEHDPLTHLPNRRQLLSHLDTVLRRTRLAEKSAALLFVDLDNFKTLNDSLGHEFGDLLLQAVSERLSQAIGSGFCARWGGDEFTVVLDDVTDADDLRGRCEVVVVAFHRPLSVGHRELTISVSVGASLYPDHASDAEELMRAADAALFRAKERGRRQAYLFSPDLLEEVSSRFAMEQSLRRAVKYGELELFYQPEVALDALEASGVEALLRWRQPDGRHATATEFLYIAEQTGLINEISDWTLRTAVRTAARWHKGRWPQVKVAVNLSSRQLWDEHLVSNVQSLLEQYELPAACLEIELTENVLQTGPATIATLRRLRELGVSIALDDFGTGFSSLNSLEQLPLSRVKIDRSLIASIDSNPRSAAIARSIIGLCHNLGLEVIAEGIERPEQLARLLIDRGLHMQGYLLSPALPASEVPDFLDTVTPRMQSIVLSLPEVMFEPDSTGAHSLRRYRAAVAAKRANGT